MSPRVTVALCRWRDAQSVTGSRGLRTVLYVLATSSFRKDLAFNDFRRKRAKIIFFSIRLERNNIIVFQWYRDITWLVDDHACYVFCYDQLIGDSARQRRTTTLLLVNDQGVFVTTSWGSRNFDTVLTNVSTSFYLHLLFPVVRYLFIIKTSSKKDRDKLDYLIKFEFGLCSKQLHFHAREIAFKRCARSHL